MKRIVICCDGTWNRLDAAHSTNVVRLAESVLPTADDGIAQVVFYDEGVGSRSTSRFKRLDRVLSGMFGWGLLDRLEAAYRFLVFNYEPGDEIYIFGFSRGAYTARSLAGLLRNCGIAIQSSAHRAHEAIRAYQSRDDADHPDSDRSRQMRAEFCPHLYLNEEELDWRLARIKGFDRDSCSKLTISYVGVWDTVGALGVPKYFLSARLFRRKKYEFHDLKLSRSVQRARHAVSIDERRLAFEPSLWDNFDTLQRPGAKRYLQLWFSGDHSSVGGGSKSAGLAMDALIWIIEGAERAGLGFHQGLVHGYREAIDFSAPTASVGRQLFHRYKWRGGLQRIEDVAPNALVRWRADPTYRPQSLNSVAPQILLPVTTHRGKTGATP